ncbi:hypothetical protein tpqmel_0619 [Candidatus Gastranaerophilus sp. (ex Termes propinquus)]|nr:hypothetical protein tpqmel_0619 [Candidatus Gastranaerophilus sp. (ex Termes propinquus)]
MFFGFFNTGYEALFSGILAAFLAQILKVVFYCIKHREINFKMFTTTGGMPSSHSAGVVGLATAVGLVEGFDSVSFAIATSFAIVVMYDAAGLRRAAGKTAATLNRLVREIREHSSEIRPQEALKELLGHTPIEVMCGAFFGMLVALFIHNIPALF